MKITIKTPKPRNPVAKPAKQRKAGEHRSNHPERRSRGVLKHSLHLLLSGRNTQGNPDA